MNTICKKRIVLVFFLFIFGYSLFSEQATVTFIRGKVELLRSDGNWYKLNVGDKIQSNETITTGFASEAKVEYNDSIMVLGAVTRCTLESLSTSSEKDNVSVFLNTGAVRSKVNHTSNKRVSYTVKTPVAVASVRGTDFTLTANGSVTCNEGAVVVYPNIYRVSKVNVNSDSEDQTEEESNTDDTSDENINNDVQIDLDYESAISTTPANEISETAPVGAIVVGQNQTVTITTQGTTETPIVNATKKTTQAKNIVTTAADNEIEVVGGSDTIVPSNDLFEDKAIPKYTSFTLEVEI